MNQDTIQQLKDLKSKFKALDGKQREQVGVCFLKLKLGVHSPEEFEIVAQFLGDFDLDYNAENLDSMMNYLHAKDHSLPEFIAMEESMTDIDKKIAEKGMASYSPEEAETLKEGVKPFKD